MRGRRHRFGTLVRRCDHPAAGLTGRREHIRIGFECGSAMTMAE